MARKSTVHYEWYIPDRVYIIRMEGLVTFNLIDTAREDVLSMLEARSNKVHLVYQIENVHIEAMVPLSYVMSVTSELYRHRNTASLVSAIGSNRLHAFLANTAGEAYSRETQHGQAVATLNDALRLVHSLDSSLPMMNV